MIKWQYWQNDLYKISHTFVTSVTSYWGNGFGMFYICIWLRISAKRIYWMVVAAWLLSGSATFDNKIWNGSNIGMCVHVCLCACMCVCLLQRLFWHDANPYENIANELLYNRIIDFNIKPIKKNHRTVIRTIQHRWTDYNPFNTQNLMYFYMQFTKLMEWNRFICTQNYWAISSNYISIEMPVIIYHLS